MKISVCYGKHCLSNGSERVSNELKDNYLKGDFKDANIEFGRCLCLGHCSDKVNLSVDGKVFFAEGDYMERIKKGVPDAQNEEIDEDTLFDNFLEDSE